MYDDPIKTDTHIWVESAKSDPILYLQRQAAETILHAIAISPGLKSTFFLKGGSSMGLRYSSPRQTSDLDFTCLIDPSPERISDLKAALNSGMVTAAARLGHIDLGLKVEKIHPKPMPIQRNKEHWPTMKIIVGYFLKSEKSTVKSQENQELRKIKLDVTFNETARNGQIIEISAGNRILAYDLNWQIAEKYRAILQQVKRGKSRRQDVFDINWLICKNNFDDYDKNDLLKTFLKCCEARKLNATKQSLDSPKVKSMSGTEWESLKLEVGAGAVPDFEECYCRVADFYRSLPWDDVKA